VRVVLIVVVVAGAVALGVSAVLCIKFVNRNQGVVHDHYSVDVKLIEYTPHASPGLRSPTNLLMASPSGIELGP
jgi:hypothetical protein